MHQGKIKPVLGQDVCTWRSQKAPQDSWRFLCLKTKQKGHWACSSKCYRKSARLLKTGSRTTLLLLGHWSQAPWTNDCKSRAALDVQKALRAWMRAEPCTVTCHETAEYTGPLSSLQQCRLCRNDAPWNFLRTLQARRVAQFSFYLSWAACFFENMYVYTSLWKMCVIRSQCWFLWWPEWLSKNRLSMLSRCFIFETTKNWTLMRDLHLMDWVAIL